MPVNRRVFGAGESPRLSQVEPQGAIEFQFPPHGEFTLVPPVLNADQPEKRLVIIEESPNLDYAWAISQISVPIITVLQILEAPPGSYVPPLTMNVKGFAGSQIIFSSPDLSGTYTPLGGGSSIISFLIDLTPFTPYPIRGGQQVSILFELNTNTQKIVGFDWLSQTIIGYVPTILYGEEGGVPGPVGAIPNQYPGVLSYRYV